MLVSEMLIVPSNIWAQESGGAIAFQTNYYPKLRVDNQNFSNSNSYTLSLKGYNLYKAPVELGMHITFGYDPSIAFSYGASLAYVARPFKDLALKSGFSVDVIQMQKDALISFVNEYEAPEDAHESLNLFLEWEVFVHPALSFFMSGNYRLATSERLVNSKLVDEQTNPDGSVTQTFSEEYANIYYGAGFHVGLGFQIHF